MAGYSDLPRPQRHDPSIHGGAQPSEGHLPGRTCCVRRLSCYHVRWARRALYIPSNCFSFGGRRSESLLSTPPPLSPDLWGLYGGEGKGEKKGLIVEEIHFYSQFDQGMLDWIGTDFVLV